VGERIVYLTNSLVDKGRKNVVALVAANIYTTTTCLITRDHLTIHPIEPIYLTRGGNFLLLKRLRLGKLLLMSWAENTAYSLCVSLLCFRTGLQIGIKAGCTMSPYLIGGSTS
jgi:hypothetical protein